MHERYSIADCLSNMDERARVRRIFQGALASRYGFGVGEELFIGILGGCFCVIVRRGAGCIAMPVHNVFVAANVDDVAVMFSLTEKMERE